jgi:hypothetical protein
VHFHPLYSTYSQILLEIRESIRYRLGNNQVFIDERAGGAKWRFFTLHRKSRLVKGKEKGARGLLGVTLD